MDVINLGKPGHMALLTQPSELVDRLEPHGLFTQPYMPVHPCTQPSTACGGVYPGWGGGGSVGGVYRYPSQKGLGGRNMTNSSIYEI